MGALVAAVIVVIVFVLLIWKNQRDRPDLVEREPVSAVEQRLLSVTSDLEHATLDLKRTVAELRGEDETATGVLGGRDRRTPPG